MQTAADFLKSIYGYSSFREGQAELIEAVLHHNDVLGVMPTGAGKSVCYQVPALLMNGITLVVSPLISLMKDQVNALTQMGVAAAYLNSSLTEAQHAEALRRARAGRYKIIYVAPERLLNERFLGFVQAADISMVTVDEAHCVSQWGHDFRQSYLDIAAFIDSLPRRPVVSAFTATATAQVRQDIVRLLRLDHPREVTTGFNRPNLYFEVQQPRDKMGALLACVRANEGRSGIVYCATRKTVEQVCEALGREGFAATRYHAGLPDAERRDNQDAFRFGQKQVMVATNAFGMGIDKSDVRYVVHYNMPKNLEGYYQEAGRAGRDGEPAVCLLLYSPQDVRTQQFLIEHADADSDTLTPEQRALVRQNDLELLKQMTFYSTTTDCLRHYILRYFGEPASGSCGHCSNCLTQYEEVDITEAARAILACVADIGRRGRSFGKSMVANVLHGSQNERIHWAGLDALPAYGGLADTPVHRIGAIIDFLVGRGLLAQTGGEYPVLALGEQSGDFMDSGGELHMKLPKARQPKEPRPARGKAAAQAADVDQDLLARLKELRLAIARKEGVPAYVVFTDATLADMCRKLPRTTEAFLEVSGVGQAKMKRYGKVFLQAIETYCTG